MLEEKVDDDVVLENKLLVYLDLTVDVYSTIIRLTTHLWN